MTSLGRSEPPYGPGRPLARSCDATARGSFRDDRVADDNHALNRDGMGARANSRTVAAPTGAIELHRVEARRVAARDRQASLSVKTEDRDPAFLQQARRLGLRVFTHPHAPASA